MYLILCATRCPTLAAFLFLRLGWGSLCPFKVQRSGVDAVAQAGRAWPVGEDVPQVAAAAGAGDFHPPHSQAQVFVLGDGFRVDGKQKTGPAAAGIELFPTQKQQRTAARAMVVSALAILRERAGERPLRSLFTQNPILLRRQ